MRYIWREINSLINACSHIISAATTPIFSSTINACIFLREIFEFALSNLVIRNDNHARVSLIKKKSIWEIDPTDYVEYVEYVVGLH